MKGITIKKPVEDIYIRCIYERMLHMSILN